MHSPSDQGTTNRRGCLLIGLIAVTVLLLFVAIALGWFGAIDTGKNTRIPIPENTS